MAWFGVMVEGRTDEPVARELVESAGHEIAATRVMGTKHALDAELRSYRRVAAVMPWLVLRDLDRAECAPALVRGLHADPPERLLIRVAVREVESWLLADRSSIARFLSVSKASVPPDPESLTHPKDRLLSIASRSRSRRIRDDMVPPRHATARVGPGYGARLVEFAGEWWNPATAASNAPSLSRCLAALSRVS